MHLFRSAACCSKPTKVIDPSIKIIPPLPSIPTPPPTGKCTEPVDEPVLEKKEECTIM